MSRSKPHRPPSPSDAAAGAPLPTPAQARMPRTSEAARRQPVILKEPAKPSRRVAEVAGGTAAECAAVCCCFPCTVVNVAVLAVVKVPTGLCRRAIRARTRRRAAALVAFKKGPTRPTAADREDLIRPQKAEEEDLEGEGLAAEAQPGEFAEMDEEMWAKFYSAGFWRSPSQREDDH